jgi:GNAT superfamily N-acetyltransferase
LLVGPAPSAVLRYLDLPGVTVALGPSAAAAHNRAGLTAFAPADADDAIDRVLDVVRAAGRDLTWFVTPRARPGDLGARLARRGLTVPPGTELVGMALSPLPAGAEPTTSSARVASVDLDELRRHVRVMAGGFGTPLAEAEATLAMYEAGAVTGCEFVQYLAYEGEQPVAYASALVDHGRRVLLLGGAATLPEQRGRGHYRALVHARLEDARRRGCHAVIVHARRRTSAPILARLGFRDVVAIDGYVMRAAGTR